MRICLLLCLPFLAFGSTACQSASFAAEVPPASRPSVAAAQPHSTPVDPSARPPEEYVVIISEDGFRPDTINAERTPNHVVFASEGMTARLARTIHESDTLPSHAAMLSGFGAREHGLLWNHFRADGGFIHVPTVFSIAHDKGLSTAMFIGKPKLRHIALPGSVDHLERPGYFCKRVAAKAAAYFVAEKPRLMFVHFSDPDDFGHRDGWMSDSYLRGIERSDACLGTVLAGIESSGLASRTLVIVTADHGGHGKVHSGSHMEVDREIPWIVRGPGIQPGGILDETVTTVDTAATVLSTLHLPLPRGIAGSPRLD